MSRLALGQVVGLVVGMLGCAGSLDDGNVPPDASVSDAPTQCTVALSYTPQDPVRSDNVKLRVDASVFNGPSIPMYSWVVTREGTPVVFEEAAADLAAIQFPIVESGVYSVSANVVGNVDYCFGGSANINVAEPGANTREMRLKIRPPLALDVPPEDVIIPVRGGVAEYSAGAFTLESGTRVTGAVTDGTSPIPAYLRFAPSGKPGAEVEAFAGTSGNFTVRVIRQAHEVLVVPSVEGYAPMQLAGWTSGQTTLTIDRGTEISGTVRAPDNQPLAGAKVQLTIDDVPSTLGTTDATGAFQVLARPRPGATVVVDVTPPAGRGLTRLHATSTTGLDLAQPVDVRFTLGTRDLANVVVRRDDAPVGNAPVALVGRLANAATVKTGTLPAVAAVGTARITAVTNASGVLPPTLAPAGALSVVTQVTAEDLAVSEVNLAAGVPAALDAPPGITVATTLASPAQDALPGAVLEAAPIGALALAGAPVRSLVADAAGTVSARWPANGHYELRLYDPQGRAALRRELDVTASTFASRYTLAVPLIVIGRITSSENLQPVGDASVQLLCIACSALERSRPAGETVSTGDGAFRVVVPDPGTM